MKSLDETGFDQELLQTPGILVAKFYADWCPDCRRIAAAYDEFSDKYLDMSFAQVNMEQNPELAKRYDVRGIPTFLVFRDGHLVDRLFSRDAKSVGQVESFVARQAPAQSAACLRCS